MLVVPGPVTSAMSVGCHELLRDREAGATLVASAAHVIEAVGGIGTDLADCRSGPGGPRDGLSDLAARVLDACPVRTGVSPERLATIAGCDVLDVLRVLPALELAELVQWTGTGWRLAPPSLRRREEPWRVGAGRHQRQVPAAAGAPDAARRLDVARRRRTVPG